MIKKLSIIGTAVVLVAIGVATLVPSAGAADDSTRRIRVRSFLDEQRIIDEAPAGESLGDQLVFSSRLKKHGERVGDLGVVCTITSVRTPTLECVATADFVDTFQGGGQIAFQGLVYPPPTQPFTLPVTGGSEVFVGVDGLVHVEPVNEHLEILTFELHR
jgi:hypothetical protein